MNNLPVDSFFFDIEQKEDIQRMAALGYSPKEIAIYLGVDVDSFVKDAYIAVSYTHLKLKTYLIPIF